MSTRCFFNHTLWIRDLIESKLPGFKGFRVWAPKPLKPQTLAPLQVVPTRQESSFAAGPKTSRLMCHWNGRRPRGKIALATAFPPRSFPRASRQDLVVTLNRGLHYRPPNIIILIMGTREEVAVILGKPHFW